MNKKIFAILSISIFLIAAVSFVCASNEEITVSMDWKDDGFESERPSGVTVNLLEDGKIIDTIILKESKLWNGSFKVSEYGDYSIEVEDVPNYTITTKNTYEDEYIVTAKIMKDSVLKASDDEPVETDDKDTSVEKASDDEPTETNQDNTPVEKTDKKVVKSNKKDTKVENTNIVIQQASNNKNVLGDIVTDPTYDGNNTNNNNTNNTNNTTNNSTNSNQTTNGNNTQNKTTTKVTTTETIKVISKEPKKENKTPEKDNNTNATDLKNTGIPVAVLILVAMAAIFIPILRKKNK